MNERTILEQLVGLTCIEAVAQSETGADLLLGFGHLVPYRDASNTKLQATHHAEHTLMIQCPWRLDGPGGIQADWTTVADDASPQKEGHLAVVNQTVQSVELSMETLDVLLHFGDGHRLTVFCGAAYDECWWLAQADGTSLVARGNRVLQVEAPGHQQP